MGHPYDALTADAMRAGGSWKWSSPGTDAHGRGLIGAFVAEMDFPAAPAVARVLAFVMHLSSRGVRGGAVYGSSDRLGAGSLDRCLRSPCLRNSRRSMTLSRPRVNTSSSRVARARASRRF